MKVVLIFNPKAGGTKTVLPSENQLREAFRLNFEGGDLQIRPTRYARHAVQLAEEAVRDHADVCIAAGGDGTMNEVATGLLGSNTALGLIPLGSGNGLARHLGISMDPMEAFLSGLKGKRSNMDVGQLNEGLFFMAAGFGFEGEVAHEFASAGSRGFLNYLLSSLKVWGRYRPVVVWERGNPESKAYFSVTFANGSQYGNNARIAPGALIDDGLLQWIRIRPFSTWRLPWFTFQLMNGSLSESRYYKTDPFTSLHLQLSGTTPGHIDGEPIMLGPDVDVQILPGALWVQTPI
jgi:diacylglycerol kinase family enzyme